MPLPFKNLRSGECLREFVDYCLKHPNERFWQALRNWTKYNFVLLANVPPEGNYDDTFYWEGKNE